jgi:hypothetical protein
MVGQEKLSNHQNYDKKQYHNQETLKDLNIASETNDHSPFRDEWEDRILKSRERNREHAKKTRLRKKMSLDAMKLRLSVLQDEVSFLPSKIFFVDLKFLSL